MRYLVLIADECAMTCRQIVDHGGVEIAFRALEECAENQNIRTKVREREMRREKDDLL